MVLRLILCTLLLLPYTMEYIFSMCTEHRERVRAKFHGGGRSWRRVHHPVSKEPVPGTEGKGLKLLMHQPLVYFQCKYDITVSFRLSQKLSSCFSVDELVFPQLSLTESEISKIGTIKVEGIINPTNAEMDMKDGVGKETCSLVLHFLLSPPSMLFTCCCPVLGTALEKAGGREFLDGVKELRKGHGPLEVASGTALMGHCCAVEAFLM